MKIRTDFVTNSSSSSFIIQTSTEIEPLLDNNFEKITKENLAEKLLNYSDWYFDDDEIEELRKSGDFTGHQISVILLWKADMLTEYNKLLEILENEDKPVYLANYIDNNYDLYYTIDGGNYGKVIFKQNH